MHGNESNYTVATVAFKLRLDNTCLQLEILFLQQYLKLMLILSPLLKTYYRFAYHWHFTKTLTMCIVHT